MGFFSKFTGLFRKAKRSYADIVRNSNLNADWAVTGLSEDAEIYQNIEGMRNRSRDLFKTNCYFKKYRDELWANVFGANGICLRMRVLETEDRVVYAADEKAHLDKAQAEHDRFINYVRSKGGSAMRRELWNKATAKVKVGEIDLYACELIERAWTEWKRKQYATMSGRFTYNDTCKQMILCAARDGDCFIRMVRDPNVNKFGFSLQLINAEYCDYNLNVSRAEGRNEIRMGIELDAWGKPVAYHFIKRQPGDWQHGISAGWYGGAHERIDAREIIHYGRPDDAENVRPAPWAVAVFNKARHHDKYEEAEVIAARVAASKMGFLWSDVVPEGGFLGDPPDPQKSPQSISVAPGEFQGLPYGVKVHDWNPNHPNQNFAEFRKSMLRSMCAGLPGASYAAVANDYESVNFSAGRLDRLTVSEEWKLLQEFHIETAERPIFEAWLEMALITRAIPLPLAKFAKFNKPVFQARRWAGIDALKEGHADTINLQNKTTSRTLLHDERGTDFEDTIIELAREKLLMEELGLSDEINGISANDDEDDQQESKPKNGKKNRASDGRFMVKIGDEND